MQLRHGLENIVRQLPGDDNVVQQYLRLPTNNRSASTFYNITADAIYSHCESLRVIWQKDLSCSIEEDVWTTLVSNVGWFMREARGEFTHYKILHRYYFTPVCLHKMGLLQNNMCWKCKVQEGSFIHVMWACPSVLPFWRDVIQTVQDWLHIPIPESAQSCLLGDGSCLPGLSKPAFALALTGFVSAARVLQS